jgi:hypothetical protein
LFITVNLVNDSFAVDVTEPESLCVTSSLCVAAIINDKDGNVGIVRINLNTDLEYLE